MTEDPSPANSTIRPAVAQDADGITRVYLESADYHAGLDAKGYSIPNPEAILARYREGRQHPLEAAADAITLVVEVGGEIVGFMDARLTQSPDPMHREMTYCYVVEIAVSSRQQGHGIGHSCCGQQKTGDAKKAPSSHHWNISRQTSVPHFSTAARLSSSATHGHQASVT